MNTKLVCLLACFGAAILFSCSGKSKTTENKFAHRDSVLVDSLVKVLKAPAFYSFKEQAFVYSDKRELKVKDTLELATNVFIDSLCFITKDSIDISMFAVKYVKNGKIGSGIMYAEDVALQSMVSKKDSTVLFVGNYLPVKDQTSIVIKAIRNRKVESEIALDTSFMQGFELEMLVLDSVALSNTNELIYVNTYYPACGYASTHYYMDYVNKSFNVIFSGVSFADAPYYSGISIYWPTKLNSKDLLYQMWGNEIQRDTSNIPRSYKIPSSIKIPNNQLIYMERWGNTDSVVNGKTIMDPEYPDEPMLFDICSERKLYQWNGTKLMQVKI